MSDELKAGLSNIRSLRAIAKDVSSEWLEDVRAKLDAIIAEKKEEEELIQLEISEREEKIQKVKTYMQEIGLDESVLALLTGSAETTKKHDKKTTIKPKYRYTNDSGQTLTWSGRGKTPKFLAEQQAKGQSLDQYLIKED